MRIERSKETGKRKIEFEWGGKAGVAKSVAEGLAGATIAILHQEILLNSNLSLPIINVASALAGTAAAGAVKEFTDHKLEAEKQKVP